jgi:hypothetical protein
MRAVDEIDDDDSRQPHHDLIRPPPEFTRYLKQSKAEWEDFFIK